jgi:hypothetical protein
MATLTDPIKEFIVQRLAMFDTPTEVADAVKAEFGITVDRRQVQLYDAERSGEKPAAKWIALFETTRAEFLTEKAKVPVAHRAVRIRELEKLYHGSKQAKNRVLAAQLLEQIAKEVGDAYTNRRVLSPEDPAEALARELGISAEELRKMAAGAAPTSSGDGT